MKAHKWTIIITSIIALCSATASAILSFCPPSVNEFWPNLTLGIFGSDLLAMICSLVGYRVERWKALSLFQRAARQHVSRLSLINVFPIGVIFKTTIEERLMAPDEYKARYRVGKARNEITPEIQTKEYEITQSCLNQTVNVLLERIRPIDNWGLRFSDIDLFSKSSKEYLNNSIFNVLLNHISSIHAHFPRFENRVTPYTQADFDIIDAIVRGFDKLYNDITQEFETGEFYKIMNGCCKARKLHKSLHTKETKSV